MSTCTHTREPALYTADESLRAGRPAEDLAGFVDGDDEELDNGLTGREARIAKGERTPSPAHRQR